MNFPRLMTLEATYGNRARWCSVTVTVLEGKRLMAFIEPLPSRTFLAEVWWYRYCFCVLYPPPFLLPCKTLFQTSLVSTYGEMSNIFQRNFAYFIFISKFNFFALSDQPISIFFWPFSFHFIMHQNLGDWGHQSHFWHYFDSKFKCVRLGGESARERQQIFIRYRKCIKIDGF